MDKKNEELIKNVKELKHQRDELKSENTFLSKQVMNTKKKNKILKVALGRLSLNNNINDDIIENKEANGEKGDTFLTDLLVE